MSEQLAAGKKFDDSLITVLKCKSLFYCPDVITKDQTLISQNKQTREAAIEVDKQ